MTGCFTDNQPDFSWLAPYEEKTFTQYFMPYKGVGMVKNATLDAAVGLEMEGGNVVVTVYTMGEEHVKIRLTRGKQILFEEDAQLDPGLHYRKEVKLPEDIREEELLVQVISEEGKELVSYRPKKEEVVKIPEPARAAPAPEERQAARICICTACIWSSTAMPPMIRRIITERGFAGTAATSA